MLLSMLLSSLGRTFVYDAETGDGGGGGGTTSTTPPASPIVQLPQNLQQGLQNLVNRQGGWDAATVLLYQENYEYREKLRKAEDDIKKMKSWLPPEGSITLEGDEAEAWKAYRGLGSIDDLKKLQGELQQAQEQLGALQKEQTLRDVADVSQYKLGVLQKLGADLDFEIREVEKDGQKAKVAFVKNGDNEAPLADYAKDNWSDFLPALQAEPPKQQPGTPYPQQNAGGGPAPKPNLVADFIKESQGSRDTKTNPLAA